VHREAAIHFKRGREILLIGHSHHPEVVGTLGQLPPGTVTLIETAHDAATFIPKDPNNLAFVTQTTLSIDDTAEIVAMLKERFPNISGPHKEDICYATTNRQLAVKKVAPVVDALIVVGAPNSSNSQRLREVASARVARSRYWRSAPAISTGACSQASRVWASPRRVGAGSDRRRDMGAFAERYELHVETVSAAERTNSFRCRVRCGPTRRKPDGGLHRRRADELAAFLAGYEIGELLSYKGIAEGVENSNFLLHTSAGYFILTLYEKRVAKGDCRSSSA